MRERETKNFVEKKVQIIERSREGEGEKERQIDRHIVQHRERRIVNERRWKKVITNGVTEEEGHKE